MTSKQPNDKAGAAGSPIVGGTQVWRDSEPDRYSTSAQASDPTANKSRRVSLGAHPPTSKKDSPYLQLVAVRTRGSRSDSEDSCSTIDSPPLPPSPSHFRWLTGATPFREWPSVTRSSTPYAATTQATEGPQRPCDWIDCPFCLSPVNNEFGGMPPQEERVSTLKHDGRPAMPTRASKTAPDVRPRPPTSHRRVRNSRASRRAGARHEKVPVAHFPLSQSTDTSKEATKRTSQATASGLSGQWVDCSIRTQGGSAISSSGCLAAKTRRNPSNQDERLEEFWEVAALLGLVR